MRSTISSTNQYGHRLRRSRSRHGLWLRGTTTFSAAVAMTLFGPSQLDLVGGDGDDIFRIGGDSDIVVAGANQDGTGGAGQTNTMEIHGVSPIQFRHRRF